MKLKGSEAIVKVLLEQGVDTVFGYPGGAVIPLYDALYDAPLKNVLTAHEQGAIHAADGYARASGRTGVCIATSGPGATNIVTGLATAYLDSIPLVAITGQVGVSMLGRDSFQEIDIVGVTMPITKYNMLVRSKEELLPALRKAFALAQEGRPGPVLVDIPSSVQVEELEWSEPQAASEAEELPQATPEQLQQAAAVLNKAQRPVLLVGGGAVNSGAQEELLELAKKADLPVVNTLMGIGVYPESDERSLGLTGMHGHIASNMAVAQADVLVVAGSRFSDRVTGDRNRYVGQKTIIQLDIDPTEIDKNIATSLSVMGDVKQTLQSMLPLVQKAAHGDWWQQIKAWDATEDRSLLAGDRLTAPWLMKELSRSFEGENPIYVTDVGQNQMWAAQYYHYRRPRQFLSSGGLGTMGYGLGAAIGAKYGCPNQLVFNISGDGCFRMNLNELATASRYNVPIIEVVLNNHVLGMVRQWQTLFYEKHYSATVLDDGVDFVKLAEAMGATGYRATSQAEFVNILKKALASSTPVVIDCIIDSDDKVWPMVAPGAAISEVFTEEDLK